MIFKPKSEMEHIFYHMLYTHGVRDRISYDTNYLRTLDFSLRIRHIETDCDVCEGRGCAERASKWILLVADWKKWRVYVDMHGSR